MLIDWFTVAAQLVNFFILVYLLKRFLYKPILRHMHQREEKISNRMQQATDKTAEAERRIEEFRRREEALEKQGRQQLAQAEREARDRKQELLDKARREVEKQRRSWVQSLHKEQDAFDRELKNRASREVIGVARRAMQDLADEALENRLADMLLRRLSDLAEKDREKFANVPDHEDIVVRSTFELDASRQRKISAALQRISNRQAEVVFREDRDLPLGVEVASGSVKLAWGISGYLDELQSRVLELIEEQSRRREDDAETGGDDAEPGQLAEPTGQEVQGA